MHKAIIALFCFSASVQASAITITAGTLTQGAFMRNVGVDGIAYSLTMSGIGFSFSGGPGGNAYGMNPQRCEEVATRCAPGTLYNPRPEAAGVGFPASVTYNGMGVSGYVDLSVGTNCIFSIQPFALTAGVTEYSVPFTFSWPNLAISNQDPHGQFVPKQVYLNNITLTGSGIASINFLDLQDGMALSWARYSFANPVASALVQQQTPEPDAAFPTAAALIWGLCMLGSRRGRAASKQASRL